MIVSPRDMDIFVMSAEKAIEACRGEVKKGEHLNRFTTNFLTPLHEWCLVSVHAPCAPGGSLVG